MGPLVRRGRRSLVGEGLVLEARDRSLPVTLK